MRERPLFIKTFAAFVVLIFLVAFIIGAIFNYSLIHYTESDISKASIGKLRVIYNINDMLIESVNREALRLSIDGNLNTIFANLKSLDNTNNLAKINDIRSIITILEQAVSSNDAISSVYVYMENSGLVISSNMGIDYVENFYDTDWLKQYNNNKMKGIKASWVKTRIPINEDVLNDELKMSVIKLNRENVISYIFPLSTYTTTLQGAIIINISESKFSRLINEKNNDEGNIFIIDSNGDVISHSDRKLVGKNISDLDYIKKITNGSLQEGYEITNINKKRQLITYYKSQFNDWIYIGSFPLDPLVDKVTTLRYKIIIYICGLVGLGFIGAYFLSKKIYNPVQTLMQSIKDYKSIDVLDSKNEFTILSKAFDSLISQEKNLNNLLEKNKANIKDKILLDIVNGLSHIYDDNSLIGLEFGYPCFTCAILAIDDYKKFCSRFPEEQFLYMKAVIVKICEEVLGADFKCYGVSMEKEKILFVINSPDSNNIETSTRIRDCFKQIQQEVAKIMENTITVGIGNVYTDINNVKLSYADATEALEMKLTKGKSSIIEYKYISTELHEIYHYPVNQEKLIINYLNNGSKDGATKAVNELVEDIRNKKGISSDNVRLIFNQFLGKIMEYFLTNNFSVTNIFGNDYNIYNQLATKETIDDIEVWLIDMFNTFISYSENRRVNDKKHINKVLEYIHKNYKKDIDVNTMAQEIGISYSQLRRVFVEELGVNLVSYVNNLRIDEAKKVLLESDRSIYEIALSLGYNNDQSFNRFFKKFEGVTPGEFRNMNKK